MSARLQTALWIVALVVTPLGAAIANAQLPDMSDSSSRTDEMRPEARPTDLRPFARSLLIGLHPAASLIDVDCLVDVDDEEATPISRLRDLGDRILRSLGSNRDDADERMRKSLLQSEDLRQIEDEWEKIWQDGNRIPNWYRRSQTKCSEPSVCEATSPAIDRNFGHALRQSEPQATCPYLKQQEECSKAERRLENPPLCDFEQNLKKLSAASKLYDRGVAHLHDGDRDGAMYLFAQVRKMVPGSRYDSGAKEEIALMEEIKRLLDAPMSVNFRDKPFKDALRELGSKAKLDIRLDKERLAEEQVDLGKPVSMAIDQVKFKSILTLLLQSFNLRYVIESDVVKVTTASHANGLPKTKFFPVEDLPNWKSLHHLIDDLGDGPISYPETVDAKQIEQLATVLRVWFLQIEPKSWACDGGLGTIEFDSSSKRLVVYQSPDVLVEIEKWLDELRRRNPANNENKEDHSGKSPSSNTESGSQGLKVSLPPIDPKIVDALRKVLKESANPTAPRLIIHVEEQPAAEEREAAVPSEWSGEPSEEDIPLLFVDPVEDKLTIASEDEDSDEPQELSPDEWSALLRDVIDAIRAGLSEEVEINAAPTGVPHREQFGGVEVEVTIGSGGEQYVKVSLSPEASGDLRAVQWAHNERILRWIESMNEPCGEGDDDAAEEEDAAYGDEPRHEAIP